MSALGRQALKSLIPLAFGAAAVAAWAADRPRVLAAAAPGRIEVAGQPVDLALPAGAALADVEPLADGWIAAATRPAGAGREIVLLTAGAGGAASLPAPKTTGRLRAEPLPLVEDGRLAGLVWLEGDEARRLAVRFARWDGAAWKPARTVSAPSPGSQLALTAARLADGSWLLAWSAFDGHDDEILWSRSDGAAWSRPARVAPDNDVPDITPALAASGDGALLAWSRFDGDGYRTVTARFSPSSGRFSAPRPVAVAVAAASTGSLFPSFEAAPDGGVWLLLRTAAPRGWSVIELDGTGQAVRRAATADGAGSPGAAARPFVEAAPGGGVAFRFPASGERRTAAWERSPVPAGQR
jgi:hypothetical protein